jgi:hypothetical protein
MADYSSCFKYHFKDMCEEHTLESYTRASKPSEILVALLSFSNGHGGADSHLNLAPQTLKLLVGGGRTLA